VMRTVAGDAHGARLRALIVLLWRAGRRISEALALQESDLDAARGAVLVRHGKAASDARSGWTVGHGTISTRGSSSGAGSRSARSYA
jgi:integrase